MSSSPFCIGWSSEDWFWIFLLALLFCRRVNLSSIEAGLVLHSMLMSVGLSWDPLVSLVVLLCGGFRYNHSTPLTLSVALTSSTELKFRQSNP